MPSAPRVRRGMKQFVDRIVSERHQAKDVEAADALIENEPADHGAAKDSVPWTLQVAAAWAWRLLLLGAALASVCYIIYRIQIVIIPALIAILLTVMFEPLMRVFVKYCRFPKSLAAAVSLILGMVVVFGLSGIASSQIINNIPELLQSARGGIDQGVKWIINESPVKLESSAVQQAWNETQSQLTSWFEDNSSRVASGAVGVVSSATTILTSTLVCLFCSFFFLKDGRKMWQWGLRLLPAEARSPLNEAAIRGWVTLGSYVRTQMLVAAIDAVGIGIGAFFLKVPMALPIAVLVFFASFVPIVGAVTTGTIAVAIAMVTQGPGTAIAMLLVILAVQQLESNVLQPFLMSSAVSLHPVAVLLVVSAGGYIAGIVGAVFAVPLVAFCNTTILYLKGYDQFLRLQYDVDRPGGPPGSLAKEMVEASRPSNENIASALKAREVARANGTIADAEDAKVQAGKTQKEVQDTLAELNEDVSTHRIPSVARPLPDQEEAAREGAKLAEDPPTSVEDLEDEEDGDDT